MSEQVGAQVEVRLAHIYEALVELLYRHSTDEQCFEVHRMNRRHVAEMSELRRELLKMSKVKP